MNKRRQGVKLFLAGCKFGRLTVIRRAFGKACWHCRCDCGRTTIVQSAALHDKSACHSCAPTRHGCCRRGGITAAYTSWQKMKARCYYVRDVDYKDYGARGIRVCKRWLRFDNFLADMGEPPKQVGYSIERVDNNRGYSKSNCTWLPRGQQAKNRRNVYLFTLDGDRQCCAEWARRFGVSATTVVWHLVKKGRSIEEVAARFGYHRGRGHK